MATQAQKQAAARVLMRVVCMIEAAQHKKCVWESVEDQYRINKAKDEIYLVVKELEK